MQRAALNARASSKEQTEGYSLDAQQKAVRDCCAQHDLTISVEFVDVKHTPPLDTLLEYDVTQGGPT